MLSDRDAEQLLDDRGSIRSRPVDPHVDRCRIGQAELDLDGVLRAEAALGFHLPESQEVGVVADVTRGVDRNHCADRAAIGVAGAQIVEAPD